MPDHPPHKDRLGSKDRAFVFVYALCSPHHMLRGTVNCVEPRAFLVWTSCSQDVLIFKL